MLVSILAMLSASSSVPALIIKFSSGTRLNRISVRMLRIIVVG